MKYTFASDLSPAEIKSRISELTIPMTSASIHQKSVRLCRCKGNRFTLIQNGEQGLVRPSRVFRGRILPKGTGSAVQGRFGLSGGTQGMILLPSLLIGGLAVLLSQPLQLSYKVIFYGAAFFSLTIPFVFASMVSTALHAARQKELLGFLETNIAGGIDPEPESVPDPISESDSAE